LTSSNVTEAGLPDTTDQVLKPALRTGALRTASVPQTSISVKAGREGSSLRSTITSSIDSQRPLDTVQRRVYCPYSEAVKVANRLFTFEKLGTGFPAGKLETNDHVPVPGFGSLPFRITASTPHCAMSVPASAVIPGLGETITCSIALNTVAHGPLPTTALNL